MKISDRTYGVDAKDPKPCKDGIDADALEKFLRALCEADHPIYALLYGLSVDMCGIVRKDDEGGEEFLTVSEFLLRSKEPRMEGSAFRLYFRQYFFKNQRKRIRRFRQCPDVLSDGEIDYEISSRDELSLKVVRREFSPLLACVCRDLILAGQPGLLWRPTAKRYGFTAADIVRLGRLVVECNDRVCEELHEEYVRIPFPLPCNERSVGLGKMEGVPVSGKG